MKNNIQQFLRKRAGNQREFEPQFQQLTVTQQLLDLQEELKHQRDLGNYLDELVQARLAAGEIPEDTDGVVNLEELSARLEVAQAEHELLQAEIAGLRMLQGRIGHALVQARALNTDGANKVAELERQRKDLVTAALARQQAAAQNRNIRGQIEGQEAIISILQSQINTLQQLLNEQLTRQEEDKAKLLENDEKSKDQDTKSGIETSVDVEEKAQDKTKQETQSSKIVQ